MIKLVIFDLDGTLLNTLRDLAKSTNYALSQQDFPTHPVEDYKFFVGNGINKLFERALPEGENTTETMLRIRHDFLSYYQTHNTDYTTPYPGITELLKQLQRRNIMSAVASNKYQEATAKLVKHYFPEVSFVKILGQRDGIAPKPDPAIVNEILTSASVSRDEVLYVGDSGVDMQTALHSSVIACGVSWGFRPRAELEAFHPSHIVDCPDDILAIIDRDRKKKGSPAKLCVLTSKNISIELKKFSPYLGNF
jgi:phosphoglycolate phosphatase